MSEYKSFDFNDDFEEPIEFNVVVYLKPDRVGEIDLAEDLIGAGGVGRLFYADFAAAVDDLEVRSAAAARIERKEIGSFGNSFVKDDFGKGGVLLYL